MIWNLINCVKAVITANRVLEMLSRSFSYLTKPVLVKLYKSLERPHFEYCTPTCRPHLNKGRRFDWNSPEESYNDDSSIESQTIRRKTCMFEIWN